MGNVAQCCQTMMDKIWARKESMSFLPLHSLAGRRGVTVHTHGNRLHRGKHCLDTRQLRLEETDLEGGVGLDSSDRLGLLAVVDLHGVEHECDYLDRRPPQGRL